MENAHFWPQFAHLLGVQPKRFSVDFPLGGGNGPATGSQKGGNALKAGVLDGKSSKTTAIMERAKARTERRERVAREFRAALMAELGERANLASQQGLIEVAVSAYVQITELFVSFARGRMRPKAMAQWSLARGQFQRALYSLGLARREPGEPEDSGLSERARHWLAGDEEPRSAPAEPEPRPGGENAPAGAGDALVPQEECGHEPDDAA